MKRRSTIKDIAEKLNIAPSTVSRAISGKKGVSEKLKKIILETAEDLKYIPNISAKSLKTNRTNTIGLIIPDIDNPFFLDVIKGVEKVLFPRGYKFIVCSTDENLEKERTYLDWLLENGVEGIIASPVQEGEGRSNMKSYKSILKRRIPLVFYDRLIRNLTEIDSVTVNNETAVMEALFNLKNAGHKKVGICLSKKGLYTMEERLKGFKKGVEALELETRPEWLLNDMHPLEKAEEKLEKFIATGDFPDGIITANHPITAILLKNTRRFGRKIPDDFSLIAFDDLLENELMSPAITTIKQPVMEIGKMAATLLLGRIDDESTPPVKVVLNCQLVHRESLRKQ